MLFQNNTLMVTTKTPKPVFFFDKNKHFDCYSVAIISITCKNKMLKMLHTKTFLRDLQKVNWNYTQNDLFIYFTAIRIVYYILFIYEYLARIASSAPAINEGPAFLVKHLQWSLMELAIISNFLHRRLHRGIELGTFRF